jgi:YegS/Rv2252/BmrU family lipid kinase
MNDKPNTNEKKAFVVFNPVAGLQNAEITRALFEERFQAAGWNYEIYETTGQESVPEIVAKAIRSGAGLIVAAGGDGTVAGVGAGVFQTNVPMAIVPAGTGNALARELGIPLDFTAALDVFLGDPIIRQIDGLQVSDKLYLLNVGIGLSARSIRETKREQKRRFGNLAYVWNITKQLTGFPLRRFDVKIDGQNRRIIASELLILNSGVIGVQKLPEDLNICPDDGRVDVYIVRAETARDYVSVLWDLLFGRKNSHPKVQSLSASKMIEINTTRPLTVQADGEIIGTTPVKIKVIPAAVAICVPPPV